MHDEREQPELLPLNEFVYAEDLKNAIASVIPHQYISETYNAVRAVVVKRIA